MQAYIALLPHSVFLFSDSLLNYDFKSYVYLKTLHICITIHI